jgi:glucosyl-3-phosphoglycerate phosphatase
MTRLLLWRHGQTEWNADGRVQGQLDVGLSAAGREQARTMAARLAEYRPDLIVASDLHRAADTAAALAQVTGLDVALDPRLRERHFGPWQGLTHPEMAARWPEEYARWRSGQPVHGVGLESVEDVAKRVSAALQDVAGRVPDGTAVVAMHGAAARYGCAALLGWPDSVRSTLAVLANCHWTELRFDAVRGWQLWAHNAN